MHTDDPVRRLCSGTQAGMARSWRRSAGQVTGPGHWYKALMLPDLAGSWPPARHRLFNAIRNGMAWATNQNLCAEVPDQHRPRLGHRATGSGRGKDGDMAETTSFDGEAEAERRIAAEAEAQTGFLDLTQLGLRRLPDSLFRLTHLRRLHLGQRLAWAGEAWRRNWGFEGPVNEIAAGLARVAALPGLEALSIQGIVCESLDFVAALPSLRWLDCSGTGVSNLGLLSGLTALRSLDCSGTHVSDLGPLSGLTVLQSLDCTGTHVSDL